MPPLIGVCRNGTTPASHYVSLAWLFSSVFVFILGYSFSADSGRRIVSETLDEITQNRQTLTESIGTCTVAWVGLPRGKRATPANKMSRTVSRRLLLNHCNSQYVSSPTNHKIYLTQGQWVIMEEAYTGRTFPMRTRFLSSRYAKHWNDWSPRLLTL